jgi:hypothetical protein
MVGVRARAAYRASLRPYRRAGRLPLLITVGPLAIDVDRLEIQAPPKKRQGRD